MHCPECHAELADQREFCPHCGTPTRMRRRERRSLPSAPASGTERSERTERTEPELKQNRRRVFMLGAALLLAIGFMSRGDWFHVDFSDDEAARPAGPAVVTAQQLYQEYFADADAADDKYRDREMVVTGEFVRVVPDGQGNPDLRLGTSNPNSQWGADLAPVAHAQAAQLRPGQQVTVSCQRMNRTGEERWLQNCAIQNVAGEGTAAEPGNEAAPERGAAATPAEEAVPATKAGGEEAAAPDAEGNTQ